jgi:hypothetical protein
VLCSFDGDAWETVFANPDALFGLDGRPLVVTLATTGPCRFVMLRLRRAGILHLDEVEVYGTPSGRERKPKGVATPPDSSHSAA